MTDVTEEAPLRPSTETNVLLGQLIAKVDALSTLGQIVSDLKADVAVLKSQQGPRMSWATVAAGLGSIVTTVSVVAALIILFTQ